MLQMNYNRRLARLSIVPLKCDTWRSLAGNPATKITVLRVFLVSCKNAFEHLEGQKALVQNQKTGITFSQYVCISKMGHFQVVEPPLGCV